MDTDPAQHRRCLSRSALSHLVDSEGAVDACSVHALALLIKPAD